MTTAPFDPAVEQLVAQPHEQTVRVTATAPDGTLIALDVIDYVLDFTERRAPRVSLSLTCPVPDPATLDKLDPRTYVVVRFYAGYRLPSGALDEHLVAKLHLRDRHVNRPANTLTLTAAGQELLIIDQSKFPPEEAGTAQTWPAGVVDWVKTYIGTFLSTGPAANPTWSVGVNLDRAPFAYGQPADWWDTMWDAAQANGFDVFDDGLGVWHIDPLPDVSADVAHDLRVGSGGTLLDTAAGLDRDDWANLVQLRYHYFDTSSGSNVDAYTYGRAQVTAGPYREATAGLKALWEDREGRPSQVQADAAAGALLTRLLSRSRSLALEAVAAWWLRPGDTVTVQLPTGAQERHIVAGLVFRTGGTMRVVTRLPDTVSTITIGA